MRYLLLTAILLTILGFSSFKAFAVDEQAKPSDAATAQEEPAQETEEPAKPATPTAPTSPAKPSANQETDNFDEGLFNDEEPPPATEAQPAAEEQTEEEKGLVTRKLTIDAVVIVNYSFQTGEKYSVKYHINMGGTVPADIGIVKGEAKVATDISGYLAKSSAFECLLKVSITEVPYEISFKKISDTEADISVLLKGQILEDWESLCTFLDTSGAKFNTRGAPEQWIGTALEKATPSLSKMTVPLDPNKATNLKFTISKTTTNDTGLGTADIEGTGVVTVVPQKKTQKYENVLAE